MAVPVSHTAVSSSRCIACRGVTRPFRQGPVGLAFDARQQPFPELRGGPARLRPNEPALKTIDDQRGGRPHASGWPPRTWAGWALLTAFEAADTPPVDGPQATAAVAGEVAAEATGVVQTGDISGTARRAALPMAPAPRVSHDGGYEEPRGRWIALFVLNCSSSGGVLRPRGVAPVSLPLARCGNRQRDSAPI